MPPPLHLKAVQLGIHGKHFLMLLFFSLAQVRAAAVLLYPSYACMLSRVWQLPCSFLQESWVQATQVSVSFEHTVG